ncbi:MAG: histidine phosphatase family protein [Bryobacteraceae bacterium]|nr:histidine phosphatase family protein [Bryobacteraceae bacterium]MDW8377575.1 histidine phosphatase family protein [Bryobacterales bacterium]
MSHLHLYLFRHGQAGTRDDYDKLSDLGARQCRLLGEYLAGEGVRLDSFYTGQLRRQQETAWHIVEAYRRAGGDVPEPLIDPCWNEFDLEAVYRSIAPQLARDDAEFRAHYEELQRESARADSSIHRRWTPSDVAVVRAWVEGRYRCEGESWAEFTERVGRTRATLSAHGPRATIAISTSATPIGIWAGMALELSPRQMLRVAGVLHNASFTIFRLRDGDVSLFGLNHVPHLREPALRTFR